MEQACQLYIILFKKNKIKNAIANLKEIKKIELSVIALPSLPCHQDL